MHNGPWLGGEETFLFFNAVRKKAKWNMVQQPVKKEIYRQYTFLHEGGISWPGENLGGNRRQAFSSKPKIKVKKKSKFRIKKGTKKASRFPEKFAIGQKEKKEIRAKK